MPPQASAHTMAPQAHSALGAPPPAKGVLRDATSRANAQACASDARDRHLAKGKQALAAAQVRRT